MWSCGGNLNSIKKTGNNLLRSFWFSVFNPATGIVVKSPQATLLFVAEDLERKARHAAKDGVTFSKV